MDIFNFPKECLVDKYVAKEKVYAHIPITESIRKLFVDSVESIRIMYVITTKTSYIPEYISEERSYKEIDIFRVEMKNKEKSNTILKLLHSCIPKTTVFMLQ